MQKMVNRALRDMKSTRMSADHKVFLSQFCLDLLKPPTRIAS